MSIQSSSSSSISSHDLPSFCMTSFLTCSHLHSSLPPGHFLCICMSKTFFGILSLYILKTLFSYLHIYKSCINKTENIYFGNSMFLGEGGVGNGGEGGCTSGIVIFALADWSVRCMTSFACSLLCRTILRPWRWRRYVPPKRQVPLNALHGVISQKKIHNWLCMDGQSLILLVGR
jgi:hypothetical protein